jgi:hypothetical protein
MPAHEESSSNPAEPPKLCEQQSENGLALAQGPTQTLGVVVEDGAGGAAFEATKSSYFTVEYK